jgi:hypothetical protein
MSYCVEFAWASKCIRHSRSCFVADGAHPSSPCNIATSAAGEQVSVRPTRLPIALHPVLPHVKARVQKVNLTLLVPLGCATARLKVAVLNGQSDPKRPFIDLGDLVPYGRGVGDGGILASQVDNYTTHCLVLKQRLGVRCHSP